MLSSMKAKFLGLAATVCMFGAAGGCAIEEWKLGLGPIFSHNSLFGGIGVELTNGLEFVIPLVRF